MTTVMANLGFHHAMRSAGIDVVSSRVGDRNVLEEMLRTGAVLGGEQSGHVIFRQHASTGDGLLTAVRFLSLAARTGRTIKDLAAIMTRYPQRLINIEVRDRDGLAEAVSVWEAVEASEGALGEEGRVLVRASGTEPLVRVMVEAQTEDLASEHAESHRGRRSRVLGRLLKRLRPPRDDPLLGSSCMCGIVGYVGPDEALPIVIEGLRRLEYRGYDSAGIAVMGDGLAVVKRAGKLSELEAALVTEGSPAGRVGMGHTRWATHGAPTDRNAHPHLDCRGRIAVIHNGIIENFQGLRDRLDKEGHTLVSETDTECIAHLIESKLAPAGTTLTDAVRFAVGELEGAYSLVVCAIDEPDLLVGVKVSSPLVVGLGDGETLLASDIPALLTAPRSWSRSRKG